MKVTVNGESGEHITIKKVESKSFFWRLIDLLILLGSMCYIGEAAYYDGMHNIPKATFSAVWALLLFQIWKTERS